MFHTIELRPCRNDPDRVSLHMLSNHGETSIALEPMSQLEARRRAEWIAGPLKARVVDRCEADIETRRAKIACGPQSRLVARYGV